MANRRKRLATETKGALKTTEFWTFLAATAGILIAAATIGNNDSGFDHFTSEKAWLYVTILTVGYLLSRGLAKSGSREPYTPETPSNGHDASIGERVTKAVQVLKEGEVQQGHESAQQPGAMAQPPQGPPQQPVAYQHNAH
jgi:hypothetical protein